MTYSCFIMKCHNCAHTTAFSSMCTKARYVRQDLHHLIWTNTCQDYTQKAALCWVRTQSYYSKWNCNLNGVPLLENRESWKGPLEGRESWKLSKLKLTNSMKGNFGQKVVRANNFCVLCLFGNNQVTDWLLGKCTKKHTRIWRDKADVRTICFSLISLSRAISRYKRRLVKLWISHRAKEWLWTDC